MNYQSYARENQDLFVLSILDKKKFGTYVEIGANQPIIDSNTYLLESLFEWRGISLEFYDDLVSMWDGTRKNPCIKCDATKIDYDNLFEEYKFSNHIDFLQIDIDPTSANYEVLRKINFEKYSFSIVTFEHNLYLSGDKSYWGGEDCHFYRQESRKYLENLGYTCLVPDVIHDNVIFEDWFINEKHMECDNWKNFIGIDPVMDTPNMKKETIDVFEKLLNLEN